MSTDTKAPDDMDICIGILAPQLADAMRALRASHPQLPLPAFAGAAAMALRMLALDDAIALQAQPDAGHILPLLPSAVKLDLIGEFVLAMRGGGFL